MEALIFLGFIALIFLYVVVSAYKGRKQWQDIARGLGATCKGRGALQGTYNGCSFSTKLRRRQKRLGKTQICIPTSGLPEGLSISRSYNGEDVLAIFKKKQQDIEVGIPELDEPLQIKGKDPEQISKLFAALQQPELILQICLSESYSFITEDTIQIEIHLWPPTLQGIQKALDLLVGCRTDLQAAAKAIK